jgi:hypothetical protein
VLCVDFLLLLIRLCSVSLNISLDYPPLLVLSGFFNVYSHSCQINKNYCTFEMINLQYNTCNNESK